MIPSLAIIAFQSQIIVRHPHSTPSTHVHLSWSHRKFFEKWWRSMALYTRCSSLEHAIWSFKQGHHCSSCPIKWRWSRNETYTASVTSPAISEQPCDLQTLHKNTIVYAAQWNGTGFETWLIFIFIFWQLGLDIINWFRQFNTFHENPHFGDSVFGNPGRTHYDLWYWSGSRMVDRCCCLPNCNVITIMKKVVIKESVYHLVTIGISVSTQIANTWKRQAVWRKLAGNHFLRMTRNDDNEMVVYLN